MQPEQAKNTRGDARGSDTISMLSTSPKTSGRPTRPLVVAIKVGLGYLAACSLYIWLSGMIAARVSGSVLELQDIELIKGLLFVLLTAAGTAILVHRLLSRIRRDQQRLDTAREVLLTSERRALAGLFAASVAHDINNILMVIRHQVDILEDPRSADESAEALDLLQRGSSRLTELSRGLMSVGREGVPGETGEYDLAGIVTEMVDFARTHRTLRLRRVATSLPDRAPWTCTPILVRQALLNLLINAADVTGPDGRIEIRLIAGDDHLLLEVHDDGPGVPAADRERIFQAFHTGKPDGKGLGLLSVKACAEAHHGRVAVSESDLGGACFAIVLGRP